MAVPLRMARVTTINRHDFVPCIDGGNDQNGGCREFFVLVGEVSPYASIVAA